MVLMCWNLEPFGSSDHNQIGFSVFVDNAIDDESCDEKIKRYDWSKADYEGMSAYLASIDWSELLTVNLTADALWEAFSEVLQCAIDMHAPAKYVSKSLTLKTSVGTRLH